MKYRPADHRPVVTVEKYTPTYEVTRYEAEHEFVTVAWHVYWKMVEKLADEEDLNAYSAHQKLQAAHPIQTKPQDNTLSGTDIWMSDDRICEFMLQFDKWQKKGYNMEKMYSHTSFNGREALRGDTSGWTLADLFEDLPDEDRRDMVHYLCHHDRWDDLKALVGDGIFGPEAQFEIGSEERSREHAVEEAWRKSQLPDSLYGIDKLLGEGAPSNYNINFPWPKNKFHSIDNCCIVTADGSTQFRLEVLDPDKATRFKLVDLCPPWWSLCSRIGEMPGPGEGEYDFPFPDFNIHEGDEFTLEQFIQVIKRGLEQMATRGDRKFGHRRQEND